MPQPIRELVPGVLHWTAVHPNTGLESSSYLLTAEDVAIDPLVPEEGLDWFERYGAPVRAVLLINRHHLRHARAFAERFGATIHASRPGLHDLPDDVEPFDFGDTLPGGVLAREIGVICPDETALVIPDVRAVAVADGVINYSGLQFVPDDLLGDDPIGVKTGLLEAYGRLAQEVDFDHLLPAHGSPVVGGARMALLDFVSLTNPG